MGEIGEFSSFQALAELRYLPGGFVPHWHGPGLWDPPLTMHGCTRRGQDVVSFTGGCPGAGRARQPEMASRLRRKR